MKRINLIAVLIVSIISFAFMIKSTSALTFDENGVHTFTGYTMTYEQYNKLSERYTDRYIDNFSINDLKALTSNDLVLLSRIKKYVITNYITDKNGNVISSLSQEVTKDIAESVANSSNIATCGNSGQPVYQTDSKVIVIDNYYSSGEYITSLTADWYTTPKVKSYDVMAIRFSSSINVKSATGIQIYGYNEVVNYSYLGNNMVKKDNGIGISMNLVDSGSDYGLALTIHSSNNAGTYYGTYQHATRDVSLANSKSYTFSSSGLGGVLKFDSNTIAGYYDNMQGVLTNS